MGRMSPQIFIHGYPGSPDIFFLIHIIRASPGIGAAGHIVGDNLHLFRLLAELFQILVHFLSADNIRGINRHLFPGLHQLIQGIPHIGCLVLRFNRIGQQGYFIRLHRPCLPVLGNQHLRIELRQLFISLFQRCSGVCYFFCFFFTDIIPAAFQFPYLLEIFPGLHQRGSFRRLLLINQQLPVNILGRRIIAQEQVRRIAPSQQISGIIYNQVFIVKPRLKLPWFQKIDRIVNSDFHAFLQCKRLKPFIPPQVKKPAETVHDNLDFYTSVCRMHQRAHHIFSALISIEIKGG